MAKIQIQRYAPEMTVLKIHTNGGDYTAQIMNGVTTSLFNNIFNIYASLASSPASWATLKQISESIEKNKK